MRPPPLISEMSAFCPCASVNKSQNLIPSPHVFADRTCSFKQL